MRDDTKIAFLCEQLELVLKPPKGRRYSPELLAWCCVLDRTSPACYGQMLSDGKLSLPCKKHLRRLTHALTLDLDFSESTRRYLKARLSKLELKDKVVSVIMDEVHTRKTSDYSNGRFFGMDENGNLTKTLLGLMVNSIAGRYRDMVSMSPVTNLTADKMKTVWTNAMKLLTEIGFHPVTTITDGLSVNMKFFKSFGESNSIPRFIPNPSAPERRNYPMCDTVHLLKNLYGNLMNYGTFVCPTFDGTNSEIEASFDHVVQVYNLELSMPIKLAHKLTDKVLDPSTLEKTNVQLFVFQCL